MQVAIGNNGVGEVVNDFVAGAVESGSQPAFGKGHSNSVGQSLTQGAGSDFDAGGQTIFRVARRLAAPLPKLLQFFQRQVISCQMKQAVEHGGSVSGRQYEPVSIGPFGIGGIVLEEPVPKHIGHGGSAHRRSRMPRPGLLNRVHGQQSKGVDAKLVKSRIGQRSPLRWDTTGTGPRRPRIWPLEGAAGAVIRQMVWYPKLTNLSSILGADSYFVLALLTFIPSLHSHSKSPPSIAPTGE